MALGAVSVAVAGWTMIRWILTPLLQFTAERQHTLKTNHRHGSVGHLAWEAGVQAARKAVDTVAARMGDYPRHGSVFDRVYCRVSRYELQWIEPTLQRVSNSIGKNVPWQ